MAVEGQWLQIPARLREAWGLHTADEVQSLVTSAAHRAAAEAASATLSEVLLANPTLGPHLERYSGGSDSYGYDPLDQDFRKYMESTGLFPIASACDQAIATTASSNPLCMFRKRPGDEEPEKVTEHPLLDLFENPNPDQGFGQFWAEGQINKERTGNAFLVAVSDRFPRMPFLAPSELWFVNSGRMKPTYSTMRRRGRSTPIVTGYSYDDGAMVYSPDEVLHIKRPNANDPAVGLSSYKELESSLNLMWSVQGEANNYMKNGSRPGMVFRQLPGSTGGMQGHDAVEAFRERIEAGNAGVKASGRNMYLSRFWEVLEKAGDSAKDATYVEVLRFLQEHILAVKGVPPFAVGLPESSNWGDSKNEQKRWFYHRSIMPSNDLFLDAINSHELVRSARAEGEKLWLAFDYSGVEALQADVDALWSRWGEAYDRGAVSLNEYRGGIALDPLDGEEGDAMKTPVSPSISFGAPPSLAARGGAVALAESRAIASDADDQDIANGILWDGAEERKKPIIKAYIRRFRPLLRALWAEVEGNMETARRERLLADGDDDPVPIGWSDPDRKWFDLGKTFRAWVDEALDLALFTVRAGAEDAATIVTGEAVPFDVERPEIEDLINTRAGIGIKLMLETQEQAIRKAAVKAVETGQTVGELTTKIREIGRGRERWWAERIARTETQPLYNTGFLTNAKDLGATTKDWLPALGGNRRPNHQAMGRTQVGIPIDGDFHDEQMGSYGPAPGMMSGGAKNNANCACAANVGSVI